MKRAVLFAVGSRANWGSVRSVVQHATGRPELAVEVCVFASALSRRYAGEWDLLEDIRSVAGERADVHVVPTLVDPSNAESAAQTAALSMQAFARLVPGRIVYVVGDRYEVLAPAYVATLAGCVVAHQMGGERSGNIDEHFRHALTKLAHWHFTANDDARKRVLGMGESAACVWDTGCPRMDLIRQAEPVLSDAPYAVVMVHPEPGLDFEAVAVRLREVCELEGLQRVQLFWPNSDPDSDTLVAKWRHWLPRSGLDTYVYRSVAPVDFYRVLKGAKFFFGNSSVAVRDCAFAGVPAYLVGERQQARLSAEGDPNAYGNGHAGERIAELLATEPLPNVQKVMPW